MPNQSVNGGLALGHGEVHDRFQLLAAGTDPIINVLHAHYTRTSFDPFGSLRVVLKQQTFYVGLATFF